MTVGVVSPGQMGSGLGWALRQGGARVIATLDGRSPRTAALAATAGLQPVPSLDALVTEADVVLVVTPPDESRTATGAHPLVAGLNATAPSTVDEFAWTYARAELSLWMVLSRVHRQMPDPARIYLSGPHAARVAGLPWRHVEPVVLDKPVGRASSVKMCTASAYKGLDGLLAQALRAAARYGVLDTVVADLRGSGLDNFGRVAVAAAKAHRYVAEMREIATAQADAGLSAALFTAFAEVYAELTASPLGAVDPEMVHRAMPPAEVVAGITPGVTRGDPSVT